MLAPRLLLTSCDTHCWGCWRGGCCQDLVSTPQHLSTTLPRQRASVPAQCQRSASAVPAQCQRSASAVPAQCQRSASVVPAQCQRSASAVPAQCQRSASAVPAQCQRSAAAGAVRPGHAHRGSSLQASSRSPHPPRIPRGCVEKQSFL